MPATALIVGAGPVGLTLAIELTRYGVPVRIVDKAPQPTDKSKALVVWPRTLELLARAGCAQAFVQTGLQALAVNILAGSTTIARIELDHVSSPYRYALMIPQSETERLLAEHLATLGVTVERSVELLSFTDSGSAVTSILRHADGTEETLETAWLLGCDGAHSAVRHQLGFQFTGSTLDSDWILGDVHLANVPHDCEVSVYWHQKGILALFPISGTRYRVIADAGPTQGATRRPDPTLDEIQAVLNQRGPSGITVSDPVWLAAFTINERKVADYRKGRAFLLGDAAHIHSPAGGQGMNTGMQDAVNLAWKLALAQRGPTHPELLSSYSVERSAVGDQVLANAGRLTAIGILRGQTPQFFRNHLARILFSLPSVRRTAAKTITELAISYPKSPLNIPNMHVHKGPYPGDRAPVRPGDPPIGAGDTPRFAVFGDGRIPADLLQRFPHLLDSTLRPPFHKRSLWLVRPDGYIALVTTAGAWQNIQDYLDQFQPSA